MRYDREVSVPKLKKWLEDVLSGKIEAPEQPPRSQTPPDKNDGAVNT